VGLDSRIAINIRVSHITSQPPGIKFSHPKWNSGRRILNHANRYGQLPVSRLIVYLRTGSHISGFRVKQDLAPVLRLKNSGNDHQSLVWQQAASSIDQLSSLPASQ
jgi:hypothetical protein